MTVNPETYNRAHQTAVFFEGGAIKAKDRMSRLNESLNGNNIKADLFTVTGDSVVHGRKVGLPAPTVDVLRTAREFALKAGYTMYVIAAEVPDVLIPKQEMVEGLKDIIQDDLI